MHRITQVVQQLANDLSLIVLLDPVQDRRVRGRGPGRKARFQIPCSVCGYAGTIARAGEFPDSLKKLPTVGQPEAAPTVWEKVAGSRPVHALLRRHKRLFMFGRLHAEPESAHSRPPSN